VHTLAIVALTVVIIIALVLGVRKLALWALRHGYQANAVVTVRCRDGHLFTTVWTPFVSVKAIRLGPVRIQYCPAGDHLTLVVRVDESELTPEQRMTAAMFHDVDVP
jgi:hypothetical protein